ncbi:MAG: hypothetical protein IAE80_28415 [Anaerolinea sp.]|nr:hypothetical protein [Anaerolinea sp.]
MKRRTLIYGSIIVGINLILIMLGIGALLQSGTRASGNEPLLVSVNVPQGETFPAQTLRLTSFTYTRTSHELLTVELEVENVTSARQTGAVWYILAPDGDPEPWRTAAYTAPEQAVDLEPGTRVKLSFAAPSAATPEGEYRLSAWVHGVTDGQRFHSDGAGAPDLLYVGPSYSFRITGVEQTQTAEGQELLSVTFYTRDNTMTPLTVEMSYTLALPGNPRPWENALFTLPFKQRRLDPGEPFVVTYRDVIDLPAGEYQLVGWLHERVSDQETVEIARFVFPELITTQ